MVKIEDTALAGVKLVTPDGYEDFRGENMELYNYKFYHENGIDIEFVQDNFSMSTQNVLRGLHGDATTWKLVSCLLGKIYLIVVNYDEKSPDFGKWISFTLSDKKRQQVLIPPQFGNGHLILSEKAIFHYKQSTYYNGPSQFSISYKDPRFKFWWPISNPIVSRRDQEADTAYTGKTH